MKAPFLMGLLASTLALTGQSPLESQVDHLRDAAMARFEQGDVRGALALNQQALRAARRLPETHWRTIENYDDAGLYYYSLGQWKRSAQHQAVAVLLACGQPELTPTFPTYLERLARAFARYRPDEDFGPIRETPSILLSDIRLNVRAHYDLRRRYFTTRALPLEPGATHRRYLYRLRPEASCIPAPEPRP